MEKSPKIICEIGCNHLGNFDIAMEMIKTAAEYCKVDIIKFQKRNNKELLSNDEYSKPHPVPENSYGVTYGDHREFLEFSADQHKDLMNFCNTNNIGYSTSVWDKTSAKEISEFSPSFLKVPSACNNNFEMLEILRDDFAGQIQLSVGMTTKDEVLQIIEFFEEKNVARERLLIYSCTSGYPVPPEDVALLEIKWLQENYGNRVFDIGFSGHHLGIALDVAAYTLGATWIERHFTKDRTWKGTDHAASLEPGGFKKLVRDLNSTYKALNFKEQDILDIEKVQRDKLKYRK